MIYEIDCSECKGSGYKECIECDPSAIVTTCQPFNHGEGCAIPCPTCKGAGGWWLGVEELCQVTMLTEEDCTKPGFVKYAECGDCEGGPVYIPLTVEEVEEYFYTEENKLHVPDKDAWFKYVIEQIATGTVKFKDQLVKLMPREG